MSRNLASVGLMAPPRMVEMIPVVASRPCCWKADVTYGVRFPWTDCSSESTKLTR